MMRGAIRLLFVASVLAAPASAQVEREDKAMDVTKSWIACVLENFGPFSKSNETADTIIEASFGRCGELEHSARSAWLPVYFGTAAGRSTQERIDNASGDTDEAMKRMRSDLRGKLLADLVQLRMPKPFQN
jgi:hypothetical protein